MKREGSVRLYQLAGRLLPGGVNSPVRAFKAVGGTPFFVERASGARIVDVDGNEYIDYVCSWGAVILGHAHIEVVDAAIAAVQRGSSYGTPTEAEVRMAQIINEAIPSIEMLRLVSSGTEACMSAIRVARGFTAREKIIKFSGCYHGHADHLLVKAGSGASTLGIPDSAGVPRSFAQHTVVLPYNNVDAFTQIMNDHHDEIAAVIVEPVAGNMGVVLPKPGFLETLRSLTRKYGVVLIFDEVISGFRVAYGGAQAVYGIQSDMTTLGKIIGGGFPVAAYGGRREIMEQVAPLGAVYQAGTLSGNPVGVAAGLKTLEVLQREKPYEHLNSLAKKLADGLRQAAEENGVAVQINRIGSMMTVFFTEHPVIDYDSAKASDTHRYARFFHAMLKRGIYFPPSQFEALFVSLAHTDAAIEQTIQAANEAFGEA